MKVVSVAFPDPVVWILVLLAPVKHLLLLKLTKLLRKLRRLLLRLLLLLLKVKLRLLLQMLLLV